MIDEKKLILHLNDWMLQESFLRHMTNPADTIAECIKAVEEQPKIGGWIPCSERLPEENEEVICCFKSGVVKALVLFNCKFHGKVYAYEKSDIIAWQPLPEAYHE